ncbi:hypothetical protein OH77DRAFT_1429884 [Trametes cingulata]|nr:hypothetical protein OH77DRAFT_1429884 [Trametes cingulata]
MKSKTKREKPRATQPYATHEQGRSCPQAAVPAVSPTVDKPPSDSSLATANAPASIPVSAALPLRDICLEQIRMKYPGFEPRDDWDLLQLGRGAPRKGTHQELYAWLDEWHAQNLALDPHIDEATTKLLDTRMEVTGKKPKPGDEHVHARPIPNSEYSVRLFPGALDAAEYCMDFVTTATGEPVNSPFEYELWNIPNPETPWLGIPVVGQLRSIEHAHGIEQKDILPGEERFVLRDGQTCMLTRPGMRPVWFTVPIRPRPPSEALNTMDRLDFPK